MSKFTIKVELQGLKIEVDGTREDAPKIAQQLGKQFGNLLQAPAVLASGNGSAVVEGEIVEPDHDAGKKSRGKTKRAGASGRTPSELLSFVPDSQYGSPVQGWITAHKAIWFLYLVGKQTSTTQMTFFRSFGIIHGGT
jgi:hypothetical protein